MIGIGTLVNAGAIIAGGALGSYVVPKVSDAVRESVFKVLGLATFLIGLQMAWSNKEMLLIIIGLALGAVIGELLHIEDRLANLVNHVEKVIGKQSGDFTANFVRISLLFCVGAMAITGSFQDALNHDPSVLFAKAVLDGTSSLVFASFMGPAVILTAIPVVLYQGALTLGASGLHAILSPGMINELAACGGILVMAIGLNVAEVVKVRVGNLLPALVLVPLLVGAKGWILLTFFS